MLWLLLALIVIACAALARTIWVAIAPPKHTLPKNADHKPALKILPTADDSDPDHALLWKTQLPALELMDQFAPKPAPRTALLEFYRESSHAYPELYEESCFGDWLNWLEQADLIVQDEGESRLTRKGREFLNHLLDSRRPL